MLSLSPVVFKRFYVAIISSIAFCLTLNAYEVRTVVMDTNGNPESFATYRIVMQLDTAKHILGVADVDGVIVCKLYDPGQYTINVSAVGKRIASRDFIVSDTSTVVELDTIMMTSDINELKEVEVIAMRPLVSREIDRIGYDVQADADAATSPLNEMLRKVPLVSVDPDGTIRIKGSTSFKIYKNGRPNKSMSTNAKELFKSIPASMVARIEVITEPGAREDAEGSPAILNIVMVENTVTRGVMGSSGIRYDIEQYYPETNTWLTGQINKLAFSGYGGFNNATRRHDETRTETETIFDDTGNRQISSNTSHNISRLGWFGVDASYEPDTLNLFTVEFSGDLSRITTHSTGYNLMRASDGSPVYSFTTTGQTHPDASLDLNGGASYQRSTGRKGEQIVLLYQISTIRNKNQSLTDYEYEGIAPVDYDAIIYDSRLHFTEQTAQLNWTRPFGKKHTLETGGKFIHRRNKSDATREYLGAATDTTRFGHTTSIAALFADYRANIGIWGFRAGLRYEYSRLESGNGGSDNQSFHATLNDIVPSAGMSLRINDANSIRLTYGASISRPGIEYLNPTIVETPTTSSCGNPNLSSATHHSLRFNYSLLEAKVNLDLSAGISLTNNGISPITWIGDRDIIYSTYANGAHHRLIDITGYMRWMIDKNTNLTFNASLNRGRYAIPALGISNSGTGGYSYINFRRQLPLKIVLGLSGGMWLDDNTLYTKVRTPGWSKVYYNISLRRSFLNEDRLGVVINVSNPFAPRYRHTVTTSVNMSATTTTNTYFRSVPSVYISAVYRFGSINVNLKKTATRINNDDVVGGPERKMPAER